MRYLYDYLPIYIKESDVFEIFLGVIKKEGIKNEINLLIDNFVEPSEYELSTLLSSAVHFIRGDFNRQSPSLLQIEEKIKDYDLYTCFNNGLSIPEDSKYNCRAFITNLLPLFKKPLENNAFEDRYNKSFRNLLKGGHEICVFSEFHKKILINEGVCVEDIKILSPTLPPIYSEMDMCLCSLYLSSKFNITYSYYLCMGSCNEGFNLEELIEFISGASEYRDKSFIFLMRGPSEEGFNIYKQRIEEKINGVVFKGISPLDEVNFIGGCEGIIDLSSPYIISLGKLKGMKMNKKIITDMNLLNLEWLEDYPTYI